MQINYFVNSFSPNFFAFSKGIGVMKLLFISSLILPMFLVHFKLF